MYTQLIPQVALETRMQVGLEDSVYCTNNSVPGVQMYVSIARHYGLFPLPVDFLTFTETIPLGSSCS